MVLRGLAYGICTLLIGVCISYPVAAEASDWNKSGDWEYGYGSKVGFDWACFGLTKASDDGFVFMLAAVQMDGDTVFTQQVSAVNANAPNPLPQSATAHFGKRSTTIELFDYEGRYANELSMYVKTFSSTYARDLRRNDRVSFEVGNTFFGDFSLKGVSNVLKFLEDCDFEKSAATTAEPQDATTANPERISFGQFGNWNVEFVDGEPVSAFSYGDQCSLSAKDAYNRADFSFMVFEDGPATINIFIDSQQDDSTWNLENRVTGKIYMNFDGMETAEVVATISPGWVTISARDEPRFFEMFIRQFPRKRILRFLGSDQQGFGVADFQLDLNGSSAAISALEECHAKKL